MSNLVEYASVPSEHNFQTMAYRRGYVDAIRNNSQLYNDWKIGKGFIPSSTQSEEERISILNVTQYSNIRGSQIYIEHAQTGELVVHPMDAGLGTSIKRLRYLQNLKGKLLDRPFADGEIGAKSQDLYFHRFLTGLRDLQYGPIADMKIRRLIKEAPNYGACSIEVMVSADSEGPMKMVYEKHKAVLEQKGIELRFVVEQSLPMIEAETRHVRSDFTAPGSHGYAGRVILDQIRSTKSQKGRVHAVYNGDGTNNSVSPEMVGFIKEKKAAFVLVTTTRTAADRKGGCLGAKVLADGTKVAGIMELAQAKDTNQEETFSKLGIDEVDGFQTEIGAQYFNTNTVLMNEEPLHLFLNKIYDEYGEEEYNRIVSPELIEKAPKDKNGTPMIAAEGALGSLVLRLAEQVKTNEQLRNLWQEISGNAEFLQIVNLSPEDRDEFFTPIKYSFDYYQQAYTDRYILDDDCTSTEDTSSRVISTVPGKVAAYNGDLVGDGYYADIQNVINTFGYSRMAGLDKIKVKGVFICPQVEWEGDVAISVPGTTHNPTVLDRDIIYSALINLGVSQYTSADVLIVRDVSITVHEDGSYEVRRIEGHP